MATYSWSGRLTLGTVLDTAEERIDDVLTIRHTYISDGLIGTADLTPETVDFAVAPPSRSRTYGLTRN